MNETPEDREARIDAGLRPVKLGPQPDEFQEAGAAMEAIIDKAYTTHKQGVTTDPTDPRLTHGVDAEPVEQAEVYLVLSDEERAKGFVRPYRDSYLHSKCQCVTSMGRELSETYARDPKFYGATYCVHCRQHLAVAEFTWTADGAVVGS